MYITLPENNVMENIKYQIERIFSQGKKIKKSQIKEEQ